MGCLLWFDFALYWQDLVVWVVCLSVWFVVFGVWWAAACCGFRLVLVLGIGVCLLCSWACFPWFMVAVLCLLVVDLLMFVRRRFARFWLVCCVVFRMLLVSAGWFGLGFNCEGV